MIQIFSLVVHVDLLESLNRSLTILFNNCFCMLVFRIIDGLNNPLVFVVLLLLQIAMFNLSKSDVQDDVVAKPNPDVSNQYCVKQVNLIHTHCCIKHGVSKHDIKQSHQRILNINELEMRVKNSCTQEGYTQHNGKDSHQSLSNCLCTNKKCVWQVCKLLIKGKITIQWKPCKNNSISESSLWFDQVRVSVFKELTHCKRNVDRVWQYNDVYPLRYQNTLSLLMSFL